MKAKTFVALVAIAALFMSGCTDAERGRLTAFGSEFRVTLYSGGQAVRTWDSSGKVLTEKDSDGYYFVDKKTGNLIRVSGDVVVEQN